MLPMWCWLQPFGQPDILMWMRRVSGSVMPIASTRSWTARLSPIEETMPSLQESAVVDREVPLGDPVGLQRLVDHRAHGLDADLVDEHLEAGARAVDAQPVLAVEDAQERLSPL